MTEDTTGQGQHVEVVPESAEPLSIHDEAIVEAGRRLLVESVDVTKNFAQQMITISTGAIPVYVALLGLAGLRQRNTTTLVLASLPSIAFLVSTLCFVLALLPRKEYLSVQMLDRIQEARGNLLRTRYRWIILGLAIFGLSIMSSIIVVLTLMGTRRG
jgi:hypothetical protein